MENLYSLYIIRKIEVFLGNKHFLGKSKFLRILKKLKPPPKSGMVVRINEGFNLFIDPLYDKGIERRLYHSGTYEAGTLWCLKHLIKPGNTVMDVGANIGLVTILASKRVGVKGKVFSFEPLPTTYDVLNKNIVLNKVDNVFAYPLALSDYKGKGDIFPNIHINRGAASLNMGSIEEEFVSVEVTTLNDWAKENNVYNVDLIKVDVEGLEYEVLRGGSDFFTQEEKPILCLEYSRDVISNYEKKDFFDFLKNEWNYRIFRSKSGKEIPSKLIQVLEEEEMPSHDNIFCFSEKILKELPQNLFENPFK